jgi:integrase
MNGSVRRNLTQARLRTNGTARIITLPPHMADQLTAHRERQAATQLPHPDDFVFTTVTGSRLYLPNLRYRVLYGAVDRANKHLDEQEKPTIPHIQLHGLRHSCITMLRSAGIADIAPNHQCNCAHPRTETTRDDARTP